MECVGEPSSLHLDSRIEKIERMMLEMNEKMGKMIEKNEKDQERGEGEEKKKKRGGKIVSREKSVEVVERYDENESEKSPPRRREEERRRSVSRSSFLYERERGPRKPKLSFPVFKGGEPYEWLDKAEHYFQVLEVKREERVAIASYYLEEKASSWWRWLKRNYEEEERRLGWSAFVDEFVKQWGPSPTVNHHGKLAKLRQEGSVLRYIEEFRNLQTLVEGWSEASLLGTFVEGLKPYLAKEVKLKQPSSLREAMRVAAILGQDNPMELRPARWGAATFQPATAGTAASSSSSQQQPRAGRAQPSILPRAPGLGQADAQPPSSQTAAGHQTAVRPAAMPRPIRPAQEPKTVKYLSREELQQYMDKGLCFRCGDRWERGHKCTTGQAHILKIGDSSSEEEEEAWDDHDTHTPNPSENGNAELSLHALTGVTRPSTMRILGLINKKEVSILVDSGSSHNFINPQVMKKIGLKGEATEPFEVKVANGEKLACNEVTKQVSIIAQGVKVVADLHILQLVGPDVVLGNAWLKTIGKVTTDYSSMTMQFQQGKKQVNWTELAQP